MEYGQYDEWKAKRKPKRKNDAYAFEKDYLIEAMITFLGYWLLWLIGFVLNIYFLRQANSRAEMGEPQKNVGCLKVLLWFNILPIILIVVVFFVAIFAQPTP